MKKRSEEYTNILLVANYESDVGYAWWLMENFWSEISFHFKKTRRNCTLIYPNINSIPDVIKSSPINIIEHDFSNKSFRSIAELLRIIKQNKIGFVYLTDRAYYDWLYFLMRIFGVRKIVNHDHTPGERPRATFHKKAIKKAIHFLRFFSCDYYIAVSKFVKKRAVESACISEKKCSYVHNGIKLFDNSKSTYAHDNFNIPKDRIEVIYNPVALDKIQNLTEDTLDHPWFKAKDFPIIISVGRLAKEKGQTYLLKAFYLIRKEIPCRLIILGDGEDRKILEK